MLAGRADGPSYAVAKQAKNTVATKRLRRGKIGSGMGLRRYRSKRFNGAPFRIRDASAMSRIHTATSYPTSLAMYAANASFQSACHRDSGGRFWVMSWAAQAMRALSISRVTSLSGQRI